MKLALETTSLSKTFTLHGRGGLQLPVFSGIDLNVYAGECLALTGHSGSGKSSLLRCLYGNYGATGGDVRIQHQGEWVSLTKAEPREVYDVRRRTMGYVSQFLRVIPPSPRSTSSLTLCAVWVSALKRPAPAPLSGCSA